MPDGSENWQVGCNPRIPERTLSTGFSNQRNVGIENPYFLAYTRSESCSPQMVEAARTVSLFRGARLNMLELDLCCSIIFVKESSGGIEPPPSRCKRVLGH